MTNLGLDAGHMTALCFNYVTVKVYKGYLWDKVVLTFGHVVLPFVLFVTLSAMICFSVLVKVLYVWILDVRIWSNQGCWVQISQIFELAAECQ